MFFLGGLGFRAWGLGFRVFSGVVFSIRDPQSSHELDHLPYAPTKHQGVNEAMVGCGNFN